LVQIDFIASERRRRKYEEKRMEKERQPSKE
jgi:hypothetical protein